MLDISKLLISEHDILKIEAATEAVVVDEIQELIANRTMKNERKIIQDLIDNEEFDEAKKACREYINRLKMLYQYVRNMNFKIGAMSQNLHREIPTPIKKAGDKNQLAKTLALQAKAKVISTYRNKPGIDRKNTIGKTHKTLNVNLKTKPKDWVQKSNTVKTSATGNIHKIENTFDDINVDDVKITKLDPTKSAGLYKRDESLDINSKISRAHRVPTQIQMYLYTGDRSDGRGAAAKRIGVNTSKVGIGGLKMVIPKSAIRYGMTQAQVLAALMTEIKYVTDWITKINDLIKEKQIANQVAEKVKSKPKFGHIENPPAQPVEPIKPLPEVQKVAQKKPYKPPTSAKQANKRGENLPPAV
jgi:hypothetical protein